MCRVTILLIHIRGLITPLITIPLNLQVNFRPKTTVKEVRSEAPGRRDALQHARG